VIFSRFWYLVLGVAVAGAMFVLFLAMGIANHAEERSAARILNSGSVAVSLYLKDDASRRATALTPLAVNGDVGDALRKAQSTDTVKELDSPVRDKANVALRKFREQAQDFVGFDALFAVDVHGRVVASENFERATGAEGFELGGYPVVADALHGYIRDDSWLFGDDLYRVVARPVETEAGAAPVGAVVGLKKVDDAFARDVVEHTGVSVVFYASGRPIIKATPPASETHLVNLTPDDLAKLAKLGAEDPYQAEGRSKPMLVREEAAYDVRALYVRLPGEAWDLGAGYAVMHQHQRLGSPAEFYANATSEEKRAVPLPLLGAVALVAALVGFVLTSFEHSAPLAGFRRGLAELANKGNAVDVLRPATYRGGYKELAALVNDALDKVASSAGVDRGPADLARVLGPLPTEPTMSAFAAVKPAAAPKVQPAAAPKEEPAPKPKAEAPAAKPRPAQVLEPAALPESLAPIEDDAPADEPPHDEAGESDAGEDEPLASAGPESDEPEDEETEWRRVFEEFLAMKRELGEPVEKLTFDKFRGTLQRNKDALVARHGCERVMFTVYEKQGRAALKASPVK